MSKPLPTLSNMPWNVMQDIVNYTDAITRLSLREFTSEFRELIDNSKVTLSKFRIVIGESNIVLMLGTDQLSDDTRIEYSEMSANQCAVVHKGICTISEAGYMQKAAADLATILSNPKCVVKHLFIHECLDTGRVNGTRPEYSDEQLSRDINTLLTLLKNYLSKFTHQLNVSSLSCLIPITQDAALHLLPYMKPGFLESIHLKNATVQVEKVLVSEQWRMAKRGRLSQRSEARLEDFLHMTHISIKDYPLTPEDIPVLVQAYLKHGSNCGLFDFDYSKNYDQAPIKRCLEQYEALDRENPDARFVKIPGTELHLEIEFGYFGTLYFWKRESLQLLNH